MSFETRLRGLEAIWEADPRQMEERRHECWRRFQALIDQGLHCTPELLEEMKACGASLGQLTKDLVLAGVISGGPPPAVGRDFTQDRKHREE